MGKRIKKINYLLRGEISKIVSKEIRMAEAMITITRVETTDDLQEAKVFVSVYPKEREREAMEELGRNVYSIQKRIDKRLRMRYVPKIIFKEEKKLREAGRIEEILAKLKGNKE